MHHFTISAISGFKVGLLIKWGTIPTTSSLGHHLQPHLFQTAIRWWLGISHTASPEGNPLVCALCPDKALDTLGHHCTTCKCGGDVTNRLRHASLSAHLEVGCGWGLDKSNTRPVDILVSNWDGSASAAFDISVTSPLNSSLVSCGSRHVIWYGC